MAAFDGIKRGIMLIDPRSGSTRWWSRPGSASYRLLALGPRGDDAIAIRSDGDGSACLVRALPDGRDQRLQVLRAALMLFGFSYGGYLAGRIIGRDHRFCAAVCCEAVADLSLLDPVSRRVHAAWLGGDAGQMPQRWEAASPAGHARHVRTPC